MKVLINIPTKNFGVDVSNKFQDFFKRLQAEIKEHLISNTDLVCGNYELETIEMFLNAFKEMQIIPDDATNGHMLKAMFPDIKIHEHEKTDICDAYIQIDIWDFSICVSKNWWEAPYKRGSKE